MAEDQHLASVKELGKHLYLDSGTLTPVLKTLEKKNLVKRERSKADERVLNVTVTDEGMALREKALEIPLAISGCVNISKEEAIELYNILQKILEV